MPQHVIVIVVCECVSVVCVFPPHPPQYTSSSEEDPCVHRQALQLLQDQLSSGDDPQ